MLNIYKYMQLKGEMVRYRFVAITYNNCSGRRLVSETIIECHLFPDYDFFSPLYGYLSTCEIKIDFIN